MTTTSVNVGLHYILYVGIVLHVLAGRSSGDDGVTEPGLVPQTLRCYVCRKEGVPCPQMKDTILTECSNAESCVLFAPGSNLTIFNPQTKNYVSIVGGHRKCVDDTVQNELTQMDIKKITYECFRNKNISNKGMTGRNFYFTGDVCLCNTDGCNGADRMTSFYGILTALPLLLVWNIS